MTGSASVSCPRTFVFFRLMVSPKSLHACEKQSINDWSSSWVWVATAASSANSLSLMRTLRTFVLALRRARLKSLPSDRGHASSDVCPGDDIWRTGCCPCSTPPPLATSLIDPKEQRNCYSLAPVPSQELPERGCRQQRTALGAPTPDFSSRFTPEAFSMTGYGRKG